MGLIYQESNAYGVEALVALERHYTPTEEKYCTAVTEAVRICDTYGIPERELVPQVRHIAAAEEYLLEHLSEDEETLQFLFTPLSGSNTCLAWFLVWDHVRPGGEKAYKYTGHTPQQRLRDIISAVGQYQEDPLPPPQQLDTICDLIAVEVTCDHDHTTRTETPATCTEDGSVTVTAEYQGMTASFTVHVGPYPGSVELYHGWIQARSNRIFLQGKQGIVGAGRDGIHATDTAATSDDQIITFTNSDPNVVDLTNPVIRATSNRDLPDECAFVDARDPGNAVITATATSITQDTVQCFVTVVPKRYDGIQATQDTIPLKLGQGADLTQYLTLLDESGVVIPELNPVNYTSLDESILSVDESGHVTALHTGTGMVRALLNTGDCALIAVEVTCDHDHTTRTETPATCTEDGSVTVICDDCNEVLSTETLPATGHSTVVKNAKDATCTEPGYTGDKVCTVCGETVKTGEVIPAAGHSYKDGKCTVCGAADPNANSGGNTGNNGTDSPNTADEAAMGLWLSLMTVAALAGAVLVLGKRYRA